MTDQLLDRVDQLCDTAAQLVADHTLADTVTKLRARLHQPLRVAIAGRANAGKSTLLNALVGERLAPTDAGECTRIVTWYTESTSYEVAAVLRDGTVRRLRFGRGDNMLHIALDDVVPTDVERLVVGWPSSRLSNVTLIDTPGLDAHDDEGSRRTLRFLGLDDDGASDVDAVIYLMRHMHRSDAAFLEAFMDRSLAQPSPANSVAVLSRADEIGAGRLDALASAGEIADRYATDPRVLALCSTVIPVAGLIAETGATLREEEMAALRELAAMRGRELDDLLLSVDRFCDQLRSPIAAATRRDLVDRLGLFGVRFALTEIRAGRVESAAGLSRALIATSGVERLRAVVEEHFTYRAKALKARSVLAGLKAAARYLQPDDPAASHQLLAAVEELETTTHDLAELRLWHLSVSGVVDLDESDLEEIRATTAASTPAARLGLAPEASPADIQTAALDRVGYWRRRAENPLTGRELEEICEILARSYEGIYAEAARPSR